MTDATFPERFLWGAATSSYQIEGAVGAGSRGPSIWDVFSHTPGRCHDGDTGDVATDHYHRWEDDLDLLAWLGVDVYRFSIAWPRVIPDGSGDVNPSGLAFYSRLVDGLLERGIQPVVTLYHWDLPAALEERGGWVARETAEHFAAYVEVVAEALGDRVDAWLTVNEPWCSAFLGYGTGIHAPGIRDDRKAIVAAHHLLLAHGLAVDVLRHTTDAPVGAALNPAPIVPASERDRDAAWLVDGTRNRWWLDGILRGEYPGDVLEAWEPICGLEHIREGDLDVIGAPIDLLGINYYTTLTVAESRSDGAWDGRIPGPGHPHVREVPAAGPRTGMGWTIDPHGLTALLLRIQRDYGDVPLMITENGAAYDDDLGPDGVDDTDRIAYLAAHVDAARAALDAGVDLRGYVVWSLMDNFEWAEGFRHRFGLVYVDRESLERIPKRSASWYRNVIRRNALAPTSRPT